MTASAQLSWPPPFSYWPLTGIAPRNDGTQQVTYQGAPLYYFIGDTQPGNTTGQGQDGIWFVVR